MPQSVPVWFLWDEATSTLLVYCRANAKRLAHLQQNPNVSLHLEAGGAREVIVITGKAEVCSNDPPADQVPAYIDLEKAWNEMSAQQGVLRAKKEPAWEAG